MSKNQNTSSIQHVNQRTTKFSRSKLILASIFFAFTFIVPQAQGIQRNNSEKWVIMFVDPAMKMNYELSWNNAYKFLEHYSIDLPMIQDRIWYESLGYTVYIDYGDDETIARAILDDRVKSIAYYGHRNGNTPKFGKRDHKGWKQYIFTLLQIRYVSQGKSGQEAYDLANSQSQNFGLRDVVNRSCGSLNNTSLADLFVTPGKSYYGVLANNYYSGNPFVSFNNEDNDWTISEYISYGYDPDPVPSPPEPIDYDSTPVNNAPKCPSFGTKTIWIGTKPYERHCGYYPNGNLRVSSPYKNRKKHGIRKELYQDGTIWDISTYENGIQKSGTYYNKDGSIKSSSW